MATVAGGGNPSWTGFMCLLAAANAGWTLADVEQAAKTAPGMEGSAARLANSQLCIVASNWFTTAV